MITSSKQSLETRNCFASLGRSNGNNDNGNGGGGSGDGGWWFNGDNSDESSSSLRYLCFLVLALSYFLLLEVKLRTRIDKERMRKTA